MTFTPPTDGQRETAKALGIVYDDSVTRSRLHNIIQSAVKQRSEALIAQLGIRIHNLVTFEGNRYIVTRVDTAKWTVTITPTVKDKGKDQTCYIIVLADPSLKIKAW